MDGSVQRARQHVFNVVHRGTLDTALRQYVKSRTHLEGFLAALTEPAGDDLMRMMGIADEFVELDILEDVLLRSLPVS